MVFVNRFEVVECFVVFEVVCDNDLDGDLCGFGLLDVLC